MPRSKAVKSIFLLLPLLFCSACDTEGLDELIDQAATVAHNMVSGPGLVAGDIQCYFHANVTGATANNEVYFRENRFLDGSAVAELTVRGQGFVSRFTPSHRDASVVTFNELGTPNQLLVRTVANDGYLHLITDYGTDTVLIDPGYCTIHNGEVFGVE